MWLLIGFEMFLALLEDQAGDNDAEEKSETSHKMCCKMYISHVLI